MQNFEHFTQTPTKKVLTKAQQQQQQPSAFAFSAETTTTTPPQSSYSSISNTTSSPTTTAGWLATQPKLNAKSKSGYILFSAEVRKRVMHENPEAGFGQVSKIVGIEWKRLSTEHKRQYETRAQFIAEERAKAALLTPPSKALQPGQIYVYCCRWHQCDFQFDSHEGLTEHIWTSHTQQMDGVEIPFECLWASCLKFRKESKPFPQLQRLKRHLREKHLNAAGRAICPKQRTKNFFVYLPPPLTPFVGNANGCAAAAAGGGASTSSSLSLSSSANAIGTKCQRQQNQSSSHHGTNNSNNNNITLLTGVEAGGRFVHHPFGKALANPMPCKMASPNSSDNTINDDGNTNDGFATATIGGGCTTPSTSGVSNNLAYLCSSTPLMAALSQPSISSPSSVSSSSAAAAATRFVLNTPKSSLSSTAAYGTAQQQQNYGGGIVNNNATTALLNGGGGGQNLVAPTTGGGGGTSRFHQQQQQQHHHYVVQQQQQQQSNAGGGGYHQQQQQESRGVLSPQHFQQQQHQPPPAPPSPAQKAIVVNGVTVMIPANAQTVILPPGYLGPQQTQQIILHTAPAPPSPPPPPAPSASTVVHHQQQQQQQIVVQQHQHQSMPSAKQQQQHQYFPSSSSSSVTNSALMNGMSPTATVQQVLHHHNNAAAASSSLASSAVGTSVVSHLQQQHVQAVQQHQYVQYHSNAAATASSVDVVQSPLFSSPTLNGVSVAPSSSQSAHAMAAGSAPIAAPSMVAPMVQQPQQVIIDSGRTVVNATPKSIEPVFVEPSTSVKVQRVLHSEAYVRYIESMYGNKVQRTVSKWDKNLQATQRNTKAPTPSSAGTSSSSVFFDAICNGNNNNNNRRQLAQQWIRLASNGSKHREEQLVHALWTLRDQLIEGNLGIARHAELPAGEPPPPPQPSTMAFTATPASLPSSSGNKNDRNNNRNGTAAMEKRLG